MSGVEATLLISILWSSFLSIITWRTLRSRVSEREPVSPENAESKVDILLVLLVIAAFALGGFLTYAMLLAI